MVETAQLQPYLEATWASPVMGDTFDRASLTTPENLQRIHEQLGTIAATASPRLIGYVREGMGWDEATAQYVVNKEVLPKTVVFYASLALTDRRLWTPDDLRRLSAGVTSTGGMYIGDQGGDRGDEEMLEACRVLGDMRPEQLIGDDPATQGVRSRLTMLGHIEENIAEFARPEDFPFVLPCFYNNVLHNEVRIQDLSRAYLASGKDPAFLRSNARRLADIATVSAGFPCVSRGLYATYRSADPSLGAPLEAVAENRQLQKAEQVWNVIVRLWDELGDWQMDTGANPQKGIFVINPFNQYDPAIIDRFCELGLVRDPQHIARLHTAFAEFHTDEEMRNRHGAYILETLRVHVRDYTRTLLAKLPERFGLYGELATRVLEIGYVNKAGDIALAGETGQ